MEVNISEIEVPKNHRQGKSNEQQIESIAASMGQVGQLEPVRVRLIMKGERGQTDGFGKVRKGKKYVLSFGHRRLEAAKKLKFKTIRAEVFPAASDLVIQTEKTAENFEQKSLSIIEQADAVTLMLNTAANGAAISGGHYEVVAALLSKTVGWVRDLAYMVLVVPQVRELAHCGLFKAGHLRQLAKIGNRYHQVVVALMALKAPDTFDGMTEIAITKQLAAVMDDADAGRVQVVSIADITKAVLALERSLERVPWKLDLPVASNRACIGCRSNTATDTGLFEGASAETGSCMDATCYLSKVDASDKAKKSVVSTLKKRKLEPTAANVKEHIPDWMKEKTAVGYARKEIKPVTKKVVASKGEGPSISDTLLEPRPGVEWKQRFGEAWRKYISDIRDRVQEILQTSATLGNVLVFQWIQSTQRTGNKITPKLARLIDAAAQPVTDKAAVLLCSTLQDEKYSPGIINIFVEDMPLFILEAWLEKVLKRSKKETGQDPKPLPVKPNEKDFKPDRKKRTKNVKKKAPAKQQTPTPKKKVLKKKNSKANKLKQADKKRVAVKDGDTVKIKKRKAKK